ncbi:MAG: hypothetical protein A3I66_13645 [Burkholderiales bacterium RIFCSPLOWO2_02_FULL_57_36]|nr:MAG: hypothetical protein A3I66_13645 [Burkholderiales bacterium RIFCSPLOWO2_02_FULL_57_36]
MKNKSAFLIFIGFASASALAQTRTENTPPQIDPPAVIQVRTIEPQTENGITYACGGVGSNEAAAMKQAASDYDLMVTFAASNGAYIADVNVDLADARGNSILKTTCGGPIMLVDFPEGGKYRVRAETGGRTLTRTAQVRDGGRAKTLAMSWPVNVVDMGLAPGLGAGQSSGASTGTSSGASGDSVR